MEKAKSTPSEIFCAFTGATLSEWQSETLNALFREDIKRVAVKSGQGVGKTMIESAAILLFLLLYKDARVVATAPTQHQLIDILWSEIGKWIGKSATLKAFFTHTKTRLYVKGFETSWWATAQTSNSVEGMQGFHADNLLIVCDEASGIENSVFEVLLGTMSGDNNKILLCGNPTRKSGYFYDAFHTHTASYWTKTVNAEEEPRVSRENIELLRQKYGEKSNLYKIRVLGEFPTSDDGTLFDIGDVERAMRFARELKEAGIEEQAIAYGADIAEFGRDMTVIGTRTKSGIVKLEEHSGKSVMETAGILYQKARDYQTPVIIDTIGVGTGVEGRLSEKKIPTVRCNFGEKAKDSIKFVNRRAECYWTLKELLSDPDRRFALPDDKSLLEELCAIKYKVTSGGKIQIIGKDDIKKILHRSPDRADCCAMLAIPPEAWYTVKVVGGW